MTSIVAPIAALRDISVADVTSQLRALHVDVRTYESAMHAEAFDRCDWWCDGELPAICGVYPRDGVSHDVCLACVIRCTEWAIEQSDGRAEFCTVEIATVAAPSPYVVLVPAPREHDLAALMPIACEVCPEARHAVARFQLAFDVIRHGQPEPVRWLLCPNCVDSCWGAAEKQHAGFTPVELTRLPESSRTGKAAA
jgi:hypothetical protein